MHHFPHWIRERIFLGAIIIAIALLWHFLAAA